MISKGYQKLESPTFCIKVELIESLVANDFDYYQVNGAGIYTELKFLKGLLRVEKDIMKTAKLYLEMEAPLLEWSDGFFGDVKLFRHDIASDDK